MPATLNVRLSRTERRATMITAVAQPFIQPTRSVKARDYISYSAIHTFQQCPLRYRFRYLDGLPELTVSASLVFGGAIHSALEFHFRRLSAGSTAPSLDILLDVYQESWKVRSDEYEEVRFGKGETVDSLNHLAGRMLATFLASPAAVPEGTIFGVEEQLRCSVLSNTPDLLARIDLITQTDDALVITDFKTARSRWSAGQAEDSAEQLLLYGELSRRLIPSRGVRLRYLVLTKTKTPVIESHVVTMNANRAYRTLHVIEQTWHAIQSGCFYPAPSPMNCSSCPFRTACRVWPDST